MRFIILLCSFFIMPKWAWSFSVNPSVGVVPQYHSRALGGLGSFKFGLQSKAGAKLIIDEDIGPDSDPTISLNSPVEAQGGVGGDLLLAQIGLMPSLDVVLESRGGGLLVQFLGESFKSRSAGSISGALSAGIYSQSAGETRSNSCIFSCDLKSRSWSSLIKSRNLNISFGYNYTADSLLGFSASYTDFDLEGDIQKINNSIPSNISQKLKGEGLAYTGALNWELVYGAQRNWVLDVSGAFGRIEYENDSSNFSAIGLSLSYIYSIN